MRQKHEILKQAQVAMNTEHEPVLESSKFKYLFLEVFIDIRDILDSKTEQIVSDIATILDSL